MKMTILMNNEVPPSVTSLNTSVLLNTSLYALFCQLMSLVFKAEDRWTYKRLSPVVLLNNTMLINNRRCSVQLQKLLINLKTLEASWFYFNVSLIAKLISSDCKRTIPAHKKYLPPWLKYLKWKSGAICLKKLPWNPNGYANIINECHKTPDIWRVQWSTGDLCRKIMLLITLSV